MVFNCFPHVLDFFFKVYPLLSVIAGSLNGAQRSAFLMEGITKFSIIKEQMLTDRRLRIISKLKLDFAFFVSLSFSRCRHEETGNIS